MGFSISYLHQAPDVNVLTPGARGVTKGTKWYSVTKGYADPPPPDFQIFAESRDFFAENHLRQNYWSYKNLHKI